jgi:hypothetical protein
MRDIYICGLNKLNNFMINHNYDIKKKETWDKVIDDKYCLHIIKRKDNSYCLCRRRKKENYENCAKHIPKEIQYCQYKDCKRRVNYFNICIYHRTVYLKEMPFYNSDIKFLLFNSSLNIKKSKTDKKKSIPLQNKKNIIFKDKDIISNYKNNLDIKKEIKNMPKVKNKDFLEFYLNNIYYIIKNNNSISLIKSNLLNILQIISNQLFLNINDNYLTLVDDEIISKRIYKNKNNLLSLPNEIKNKILNITLDCIKNDKINISKNNYSMFKQYNEYNGYSYQIDLNKYKIGDCIIHRGNTKWAYKDKKMYIRSWCIHCKQPNNEKLDENYFKYPDKYKCKSCRHEERYPCGGVLSPTGYKICKNCYERFKYKNYNTDFYCNNCYYIIKLFTPRYLYNIYRYTYKYFCEIKNRKIITREPIYNRLISYKKIKKDYYKKKFNIKYNKLLKINEKTIKWADTKLKSDYYKDKLKDIIIYDMYELNENISKNGKNLDFIRITYRSIYCKLHNSWWICSIEDDDDKHDYNLIINQEWKEYGVHEDDLYKSFMKI